MCGDLDEDARLDEELFAWLIANAATHDASPGDASVARQNPIPGEPGSNEYMTAVFRQELARALTDVSAVREGARVEAIRSHAIVLARLAGFLAGHLPPESDIFRDLVDALMDGNREPEQAARDRHEDHQHHHGPGESHHNGSAHDH